MRPGGQVKFVRALQHKISHCTIPAAAEASVAIRLQEREFTDSLQEHPWGRRSANPPSSAQRLWVQILRRNDLLRDPKANQNPPTGDL